LLIFAYYLFFDQGNEISRVLLGTSVGKDHLENPGVDVKILKWMRMYEVDLSGSG
jgi:hypothetical protein